MFRNTRYSCFCSPCRDLGLPVAWNSELPGFSSVSMAPMPTLQLYLRCSLHCQSIIMGFMVEYWSLNCFLPIVLSTLDAVFTVGTADGVGNFRKMRDAIMLVEEQILKPEVLPALRFHVLSQKT